MRSSSAKISPIVTTVITRMLDSASTAMSDTVAEGPVTRRSRPSGAPSRTTSRTCSTWWMAEGAPVKPGMPTWR